MRPNLSGNSAFTVISATFVAKYSVEVLATVGFTSEVSGLHHVRCDAIELKTNLLTD